MTVDLTDYFGWREQEGEEADREALRERQMRFGEAPGVTEKSGHLTGGDGRDVALTKKLEGSENANHRLQAR